MRVRAIFISLLLLAGAACDAGTIIGCCSIGGDVGLRVVNAYTTPVDVLIDGTVAASAVAAGAVTTVTPTLGTHIVTLRATGSASAGSAQSVTTATGALNTVAAVRQSDGTVASATLDDTSDAVPTGATKVRVIHLAPNAGTLQVYRTQPDFANPTAWQTPFNYQTDLTSLSAPFYQSTVGTWEIRIWQTPADASGWDTAPVRVTIPLASGEKKTVLILDQAGGGVRVQLI
jgi:hypothetical protein